MTDLPARATLVQVLEEARSLGHLGPGDVEIHIRHAGAFAAAAEARFGPAGPEYFLDLGTGAGVPGLALACRWPGARALLVDGSTRRCAFVREAVVALHLDDRVEVREARAEELAAQPRERERAPLVVARSCAAPAVTAEFAAPLVAVGGFVIVSEPPGGGAAGERWPSPGLAEFGFGPAEFERYDGFGVAVLPKRDAAPDRLPRRVGMAAKRPAW